MRWWGVDATAELFSKQAFVYRNGRMQGLSLPGEAIGNGVDINDSGHAVTQSFINTNSGFEIRGAIHPPAGPPTVLSLPGGVVAPHGINNRGQVFGQSAAVAGNAAAGFFYDNGRMVHFGGGGTYPLDMNESGQIVGVTELDSATSLPLQRWQGDAHRRSERLRGGRGHQRPGPGLGLQLPDGRGAETFLYSDGQLRAIGNLGGRLHRPCHLNELGQVVGFSSLPERNHAISTPSSTATTTAGRLT